MELLVILIKPMSHSTTSPVIELTGSGLGELPAAIPGGCLTTKNPVKLSLYYGLFCFSAL